MRPTTPKFYSALRPVLDLMQTLPTFVYLIPAIVFFGIGMVPGLIATAIFVIPAPIRLTHLGISTTPKELKRGGPGLRGDAGPAPAQGRIAVGAAADHGRADADDHAQSLSMVVIAALSAPTGSACRWCARSIPSTPSLGFEAGLVIVVVAIVLDRVFRRE